MSQPNANTAELPIADDQSRKDEYLTFIIGKEEYGVEILRVQEVKGWEGVRVIPNLPQFIKGVINLRGDIVPIIDLRERFNLPVVELDKLTVVIILRVRGDKGEQIMGITVDAVSEVYTFNEDQLKPPPEFGGATSLTFIRNIASVDKKTIILLDVDELLYRDLGSFSQKLPQTRDTTAETNADSSETSTSLKVDMLENSFKALSSKGEEIVSTFYTELFKRHPDVKPMFEKIPISEQKKKLLAALQLVIDNLRKPEKLADALKGLGKNHENYGALPAHYDAVAAVLLDVLKQTAGKLWTPELKNAWTNALLVIKNAMLSGYSTAITEQEISHLETSFEALAGHGDAIVAKFYDTLFSQYPTVKPMFANTTQEEQQKKLLAALTLVIRNLRKPGTLENALKTLGTKHQNFGALAEHYDIVAGILLDVLKEFAGSLWTDDVSNAWHKALIHTKTTMLQGYQP